MGKVIGTDVGANNPVAIVMEGGKPTVITNRKGSRATHLVVALTKAGERLVDQLANLQAMLDSQDTTCTEPTLGRTAKAGDAATSIPV
jgi:molecular chaperone DnaK (HSP70)